MRFLVVGAGLCGLTVASCLSQDHEVVVLEKEAEVGGLARSFRYGSSTFDIGPHFFTAHEKGVESHFVSIFPDPETQLLHGHRRICLFNDEFYSGWPPSMLDMMRFGPLNIASAGMHMVVSTLHKQKYDSSEGYFRGTYGDNLSAQIFVPLVSGLTKVPCSEVDPLFAQMALNVPTKEKDLNVIKVAYRLLTGKKTPFHYPVRGMDQFAKELETKILSSDNAKIITGANIKSLEGRRIHFIDEKGMSKEEKFDRLIWTAPITELCVLLGIDRTGLDFVHLVLYNIELKKEEGHKYHYSYIISKKSQFHRITLFDNISPLLSNYRLASFERTTLNPVESLELSREEREDISSTLLRLGVTRSEKEIVSIHKEFVRNAYPLPRMGFKQRLEKTTSRIKGQNPDVLLLGRSGSYSYLNMDEVVGQALDFFKSFLSNQN